MDYDDIDYDEGYSMKDIDYDEGYSMKDIDYNWSNSDMDYETDSDFDSEIIVTQIIGVL